MSNTGVHDFAIPHGSAEPTRDMVIIRMPTPPKMVGSLHIPDTTRDMAQHNVMAGRIVKMGPLAFQYKDGEGLSRQDVKVGDWVVIRPFAGTLMMGGKVAGMSGWRYVSSFQDVIAILPADKMPDPATLLWGEDESQQAVEGATEPAFVEDPKTGRRFNREGDQLPDGVRERIVYPGSR